jgi:hypothetical protein
MRRANMISLNTSTHFGQKSPLAPPKTPDEDLDHVHERVLERERTPALVSPLRASGVSLSQAIRFGLAVLAIVGLAIAFGSTDLSVHYRAAARKRR